MPLTRQERATKAANASWTPQGRTERAIRALVDNWPKLTDEQKQTLRDRMAPITKGR